jgi:hypothetical protein
MPGPLLLGESAALEAPSTMSKISHVSLDSDNYFPGHYSIKPRPGLNQLAVYNYKLCHQHPVDDDDDEEEDDVDPVMKPRSESFSKWYPWEQLEEHVIETIRILYPSSTTCFWCLGVLMSRFQGLSGQCRHRCMAMPASSYINPVLIAAVM